ncbi:MAG: hypothetical protein H8E44_19600 [Planctomycetes bacterium]|nr:hypothetical protein [Planctomycetota bacterium]MBL7038087.1 hypothetical protein [Pirellulaceae bacterium]
MPPTGNNDEGPRGGSAAKVYSVPRRYDLATLFAVSIAYSLAFGVMRLCNCPPTLFVILAGFVTSVGLGQALLFKGKAPRAASVLVGVTFWFVGAIVVAVQGAGTDVARAIADVFPLVFILLIPAALTGYITGVAVGGVFLIAENARKFARRVVGRER